MNVNEAFLQFKKEHPELVILSGYEYGSFFVFNAVPREYVNNGRSNMVFDSTYSVSKETGEISPFDPLSISEEEYKNSKKLPIGNASITGSTKVSELTKSNNEVAMKWLRENRSKGR